MYKRTTMTWGESEYAKMEGARRRLGFTRGHLRYTDPALYHIVAHRAKRSLWGTVFVLADVLEVPVLYLYKGEEVSFEYTFKILMDNLGEEYDEEGGVWYKRRKALLKKAKTEPWFQDWERGMHEEKQALFDAYRGDEG